MSDIFELTVQFRLIERAILAIVFVGTALFLIFSYRKDTSTEEIHAELSGSKIALPLAKPFVAALLLLGYVFISLSHPVSVEHHKTPDGQEDRILFFESREVPNIFTNLAFREVAAGNIDTENLLSAQEILRLTLRIEALKSGEKASEVSRVLSDQSLTFNQVKEAVENLEK